MKAALIVFLLAGCAQTPGVVVENPPESVESESLTIYDHPKEPANRPKKAVPPKPPPEKKEAATPKVLPPCESVPGDKRTALIQKFECLLETADKPVVPNK